MAEREQKRKAAPARETDEVVEAPAATETRMVDQMRADPLLGPAVDAYPNAIGRLGRPEEVAEAIVFLLSAANIVGAVLYVDGGTDAMLHPISPPGWEVGPIEA